MQKIIKIIQSKPQLQENLSRQLGISKILAQVLINRGIESVEDAQRFLEPRLADQACHRGTKEKREDFDIWRL